MALDEATVELGPSSRIVTRAATLSISWAARSRPKAGGDSQDAYDQVGRAWAVADGMGSKREAAPSANLAAERFVGVANQLEAPQLRTAIRQIHDELVDGWGDDAGTTLVGVVIRDDTAVIANVGDTRAYLLEASRLTLLTRDHTAREYAIELGADPADIEAVDLDALTSHLGMGESPDIRIHATRLRPGSRLIVVTDGIWKVLEPRTIAHYSGRPDLSDVVDSLVDGAFQAGTTDDATALVIGAEA